MKVVKPTKLSVLFRSYEVGEECQLAVALIIFFPLEQPARLLPEFTLWKFLSEQLGKEAILDMGLPKPLGEVLTTGQCFAPNGKPLPGMQVRIRVGHLNKTLNVYGNRYWKNLGPVAKITDAEPFAQMPLDWQHAFGGGDFALNPVGKGILPVLTAKGDSLVPLPNVEDPHRLIGSPKDRPAPAGFGPYEFIWPQRFAKLGTYDDRWKRERFPGFAEDLDWAAFNAAPEDQRFPGYLKGGEPIEIIGMHPTKAALSSQIPDWRPRCFINKKVGSIELQEIPCRCETLWLFPETERGVLLYRGVARVETDDAYDVKQLLLGLEDRDRPKPDDHYRRVLEMRLDPKKGALASIRDKDLLPEPRAFPPIAEEADEFTALLTPKLHTRNNLRRRAEKELATVRSKAAEARQQLADECARAGVAMPELAGFEEFTSMALPPDPPMPTKVDDFDLDAVMKEADETISRAEKTAAEHERAAAEHLEKLRQKCKDNNIDLDKLTKEAQAKQTARPRFSAKEEFQRLRDLRETMRQEGVENAEIDQKLDDPAFYKLLEDAEKQSEESYRKYAGYFPPPVPLSDADSRKLRELLLEKHRKHESLAGIDASGANLSGIDLSGADLTNALLAGANLQGANLGGANLTGACLAHADCAGLKAMKTRLVGASMGKANFRSADLSGADLSKSLCREAVFESAKLTDANLSGCDLQLGAKLQKADLSGSQLADNRLVGGELNGIKLSGADLTKTIFLECAMADADLSKAKIDRVVFLKVKADGINLNAAHGNKLIAIHETSMAGAQLQGAQLPEALMRGINLESADFKNAVVDQADFSESNLKKAKLTSVSAKRSRFNRTELEGANLSASDFFEASLQKASLPNVSLAGANLYSVDFLKVVISDKTDFSRANLKKTLLQDGIPKDNGRLATNKTPGKDRA